MSKDASEAPRRTFAELLIDCEEDRVLRAVLVGMLPEIDRPPHEALGSLLRTASRSSSGGRVAGFRA
jgi:hypothetical protein